jgi:nickel/cobalt exporter
VTERADRMDKRVPLRELLALGITGGIIPCPAALVVLLSAVALHRIGFGLFLILSFSLGLAAVLMVMGLLMVFARNFMSRFRNEGPLFIRWLPMASAVVMSVLGFGIAAKALLAAGIVQIHWPA